jgi:hypothetical protein
MLPRSAERGRRKAPWVHMAAVVEMTVIHIEFAE